MKKITFVFLLLLNLSTLSLVYSEGFSLGQEPEKQIFVNNRILAKVNGKAISVMDIMKKMDMNFYKQYPQYASSSMARFQFYQLSWKPVLQQLIDKELLLADAAELKLTISSGDIRQEMETHFGPNIIENLDKVGLSFEEAWKMVQEDAIIKRMLYFKAHQKASKRITPQDVRNAYEEFAKDNTRPEEWHYKVVTIRDPDATQGAEVANYIYQLLREKQIPFDELPKHATSYSNWKSTTKITVSEEFHHNDKDFSEAYKEEIKKLSDNTYSKPVAQKSRKEKGQVYRIFYLKEFVPAGVVPFNEVEAKLQDQLIDKAVSEETEVYLNKLRKHYNVQESLLSADKDTFEPFVLR